MKEDYAPLAEIGELNPVQLAILALKMDNAMSTYIELHFDEPYLDMGPMYDIADLYKDAANEIARRASEGDSDV